MGKTHDNRILIIDNDAKQTQTLTSQLQSDGFPSVTASTGEEGLQLMREGFPDLILLALDWPDHGGLALCHAIREESDVPIILLCERNSDEDCIKGLQGGADDCVARPFNHRELTARIEAVLRRANAAPFRAGLPSGFYSHVPMESILQVGNVRLELTTCRVHINNVIKTLTPNEFRLMAVFMRAPGEVFTREDLRRRVWPDDQHSLHLVEVHIANLRAKIEPDPHHPEYIVTVRSRGYKFSTPSSTESQ